MGRHAGLLLCGLGSKATPAISECASLGDVIANTAF